MKNNKSEYYAEFFNEYFKKLQVPVAVHLLKKFDALPDCINFGRGLPSPDSIPIDAIKNITQKILEKSKIDNILQYSWSKGSEKFIDVIYQEEHKKIISLKRENVFACIGSQGGFSRLCDIVLDKGDYCLTESPTYSAAIMELKRHKAQIIDIPFEERINNPDGIDIEYLKKKLKKYGNKIKFFYTVPDNQNPTGITTCPSKRQEILNLATKFNFLIIEDSPYRFLNYKQPDLKSYAEIGFESGLIVSLNSFSKTIAPGLRVGYTLSPERFYWAYDNLEHGRLMSLPSLNMDIVAEYIKEGKFKKHLEKIKILYSEQMNQLLDSLKGAFGDSSISWIKPKGGMFCWLKLNKEYNDSLFDKFLKFKVLALPSEGFYPNKKNKTNLRLNFSYHPKEKIKEGIIRLKKSLDELL